MRADACHRLVDRDDYLRRRPDAQAGLGAAERQRLATLRSPEAAGDFVAGHLVLRECAADLLGVPAESVRIEQECPGCGGPHGQHA